MHLTPPKHIAIIMDGNGKWAKAKLLPKNLGHKKGAEAAEKIIKACRKMGVEYLTLYAFSSENWQRPEEEVKYLMNLLKDYLINNISKFIKEGIKVKFIGERTNLSTKIQELIDKAEKESMNNTFTLIIALSYGGRDEIRQAALNFAHYIQQENKNIKEIAKEEFDQFLYTNNIPDPDLLIRTGGEYRISNFLLWQLSYSELYFTDKLWPDFGEKELSEAINDYNKRTRRYGR
ncbi:isoprenyl transferase [Candidatus Jidaibacter acanthamoebae]|uniref:isoprenyl transferase n=1 Tax=Candidatus Jidaibacter acanthamoebae TaxID=86105 RepID=UPI00057F8FA5|nr:isoprenyl transferase [Candidatus Jidaibacter acanthamoeba]